ncbi:flagellar biosynthetic protein FliR [Acuticoccus kandeliae]|uniref:flagellar biosynthetic protein FliR n=1 Tax=Acuticoccus kandeliae TaxID=2073160 RepID=UPI000D3EA270|nr:flagellar biosynthetic protein FliR [Acuticoccus kandeliae]
MSETALSNQVLGIAVVFARVAGVFLIAPGLSSLRVPVQARVFLALGVALAVTPIVLPGAVARVEGTDPAGLLAIIVSETATGLLIGLLSRLLLMALQTLSVGIANAIGLGGIPGTSIEGGEPSQAAANVFMVTAIAILFLADLHYEILRGLIGSYAVIAPGGGLDLRAALVAVTDRVSEAFLVALRLAAPFIIYSVVVNFAVGLTNKMTPQIPAFFVALPFITAGGLLMMTVTIREMMFAFMDAFRQLSAGL